jgi:predicted nucleotidyltransferase component of viral defense system
MGALFQDVWVVWYLQARFAAPFGEHLVFNGGTSLSKAYDVIERFSEDVDLTYDIRALVDDPAAGDPVDLTAARVRALSTDIAGRSCPTCSTRSSHPS